MIKRIIDIIVVCTTLSLGLFLCGCNGEESSSKKPTDTPTPTPTPNLGGITFSGPWIDSIVLCDLAGDDIFCDRSITSNGSLVTGKAIVGVDENGDYFGAGIKSKASTGINFRRYFEISSPTDVSLTASLVGKLTLEDVPGSSMVDAAVMVVDAYTYRSGTSPRRN